MEQAEMFDLAVIEDKARKRSWLAEYASAIAQHGAAVPQAMVARALGVSRQRVAQFVASGRLGSFEVHGERFVPLRAAILFLTEERKPGRPGWQKKDA